MRTKISWKRNSTVIEVLAAAALPGGLQVSGRQKLPERCLRLQEEVLLPSTLAKVIHCLAWLSLRSSFWRKLAGKTAELRRNASDL